MTVGGPSGSEVGRADSGPVGTAGGARAERGSTFRALRHRNYRLLWVGQIGHSGSAWMEQVVRPLLTFYLTESAFQVGLVVAIRLVPVFLLGMLAGVIADRADKRRILLCGQLVILIMHVTLGVLIVSGLVAMWHVYVTAFISGSGMAFIQPVRHTIVPRVVPREDLLNALALHQTAQNTMRVAGAGLAGLLLVFLEFGQVYLLNGLIYVGVVWMTYLMSVPEDARAHRPRSSLLREWLDGMRWVRGNRRILYLVAMPLVLFIFGHPYQQVFVPLLAIDVLQIGRSGVGWMLALTGLGAVASALTVASRGRIARRELVMGVALVSFCLALILLANSRPLWLAAAALFLAGASFVTYTGLNNSLLLEETPPEFHGRVMSLLTLDRGLIPIGAVLAGALAEGVGPRVGLTLMASLCIGLALAAWLTMGVVTRLRHRPN